MWCALLESVNVIGGGCTDSHRSDSAESSLRHGVVSRIGALERWSPPDFRDVSLRAKRVHKLIMHIVHISCQIGRDVRPGRIERVEYNVRREALPAGIGVFAADPARRVNFRLTGIEVRIIDQSPI